MYSVLLTQYDGAILGPIAKVLGIIMNAIFIILDKIGIPNIGLTIIFFTIVIYLLMTPLTYKQQKFSKLSQKMNPEIKKIQDKYKGKKDPDSMNKMNEETKAVYDKYGVSPSGSCVQLLITLPVMFALYRVIYAIPAYITKIGDTFSILAEKIISVDNGNFLSNTGVDSVDNMIRQYGKSFTEGTNIHNGVIDIINKVTSTDLHMIADHYNLNELTYDGDIIISKLGSNGEIITRGLIDKYNNFLGLNIGDSPSAIINLAWHNANGIKWGMLIGALCIPLLAALSQWINTKLMPQPESDSKDRNAAQDSMAASMKSMNVMMPIMSAVFCFSFPSGVGIYWIAGAVVRSVQQIVINKMIDKENIDELIEKNVEKAKKKAEKQGVKAETLNKSAQINAKRISDISAKSSAEKEEAINKAKEYYSKSSAPGSLSAKANMVKTYNEKNSQNK